MSKAIALQGEKMEKKIELVDIDIDQMSVKDVKAFAFLYHELLIHSEGITVPLAMNEEHKQICSFGQICLCFIALEKAMKKSLSMSLISDIDTKGNKYKTVALVPSEKSSREEEGFTVRPPLVKEKKRSNKTEQSAGQAEQTAGQTEQTAGQTAIADDNQAIAVEIMLALKKANVIKPKIDDIEVIDAIYPIINKYFG